MSSYILLRNKVESKSLSLEELQTLGLMSTDLIWVECQSWDWQRPHEIPELKVLLGEQGKPLRPHETNVAAKKQESLVPAFITEPQKSILTENQEGIKVQKTILPETESNIETNKITIANSLTESTTGIKNIPEKDNAYSPIENEGSYSDENFDPTPLYDKVISKEKAQGTNSINDQAASKAKEVPTTLQTNYSRSLDEIKELYVRNLVQKDRPGRGKEIWTPALFKKAGVYIGFAVAGAMVVLLTRNGTNKKSIAVDLPATAIVQAANDTVVNQPVENIADFEQVSAADIPSTPDIITPTPQERRPNEQPASVVAEKKPIEKPDKEAGKEVVTETPEQPEVTIPKKLVPPADISSQLTLRANEYVTGSFGGIRDLQMTLQNDSKYMLDVVKVEISYLNLDHITVHKEQVVFRSVDPGKSETIAVKKTRRGVRVKYKILKIESGDAGHTAGF